MLGNEVKLQSDGKQWHASVGRATGPTHRRKIQAAISLCERLHSIVNSQQVLIAELREKTHWTLLERLHNENNSLHRENRRLSEQLQAKGE
ncbi:MAG: hypothetical protein P4N59_03600 [Negativicutes bacterium]|nr:hypothetical protein [Negativicutes bacterium]